MELRTSIERKPVAVVRKVHRLVGVSLSLAVLALAVTGLVLIHQKDWTWLKRLEVPAPLVPGWSAITMAQKGSQIKALAMDHSPGSSRADIIAATKAGLFRQTAGQWSEVGPGLDQPEVTALLITESRWLIGTQQGLFMSENAGGTWQAVQDIGGDIPLGKITTIQRSPSHPETLFLGSKTGAYESRDGGRHWASLASRTGASAGLAGEISVMSFDSSQPEYVFFGTKRGVYRYHQVSGLVETVNLDPLERLVAAKPMTMTLDVYLNDLHTGKLFAEKLWPLYDLTAVGLVLFVGTGFYMWIYPQLRRRQLGFGRTSLPVSAPSPRAESGRAPAQAVER